MGMIRPTGAATVSLRTPCPCGNAFVSNGYVRCCCPLCWAGALRFFLCPRAPVCALPRLFDSQHCFSLGFASSPCCVIVGTYFSMSFMYVCYCWSLKPTSYFLVSLCPKKLSPIGDGRRPGDLVRRMRVKWHRILRVGISPTTRSQTLCIIYNLHDRVV